MSSSLTCIVLQLVISGDLNFVPRILIRSLAQTYGWNGRKSIIPNLAMSYRFASPNLQFHQPPVHIVRLPKIWLFSPALGFCYFCTTPFAPLGYLFPGVPEAGGKLRLPCSFQHDFEGWPLKIATWLRQRRHSGVNRVPQNSNVSTLKYRV